MAAEKEAGPRGDSFRSDVRRRVLAVGMVVVLVAATGLGLDHLAGTRDAGAGVGRGAVTGAWFCPHGGSPGWSGWIVLANPSADTVRVRLTELTAGKPRSVSSFFVGPRRHVYREVSAQDPADATIVEYFGGQIGAGAVIASSLPSRVAAERCESSPRRTWYLLDEPTGSGETAFVVVMNPFAQDAAFDLSARTEHRSIAPGSLRPYVLAARSSVAFRMNDIALDGPGEQTVVVTVTGRVGRVVAGGLALSAGGMRLEGGVIPSRTVYVPAGGHSGSAEVVLDNPGASRTGLSLVGSGTAGQRVLSGPEGISLAKTEVRTVDVEDLTGGVVVQTDSRGAVSAVLRVSGPGGEEATVAGTSAPSRAWLALPALTPKGGRSFLVLQNPGRSALRLSVQLFGIGGEIPAPRLSSISLPSGRTISVRLPVGTRPATALVRALEGTVVVGTASYPAGGGYAAMLALPM